MLHESAAMHFVRATSGGTSFLRMLTISAADLRNEKAPCVFGAFSNSSQSNIFLTRSRCFDIDRNCLRFSEAADEFVSQLLVVFQCFGFRVVVGDKLAIGCSPYYGLIRADRPKYRNLASLGNR